jgi:hypothetical protein
MKNYLTMTTTMIAILGSAVLLSSFVATSAFAQDPPYHEEYMKQHDGGDREMNIYKKWNTAIRSSMYHP